MPGVPLLIADSGPLSYEGWILFLKGAWVGLAMTAPPGPVGGLAVRRTVREGLVAGLSTALGALIADVILGVVAMLPASQFRGLGRPWDALIAVAVAATLIFLGVRFFRRALRGEVFDESSADVKLPGGGPERRGIAGFVGLTIGTFLLTLMTPLTIPAFIGFFTQMKLGKSAAETAGGPFFVIAGVTVGAAIWWFTLCAVVNRFRSRAQSWLRGMEFFCAGLMFVGAGFALIKGLGWA